MRRLVFNSLPVLIMIFACAELTAVDVATEAELRSAILTSDVTLTADITLTGGELTVTSSRTINGGDHTLASDGSARVIRVDGSAIAVQVNDLTVTGGVVSSDDDGAGIMLDDGQLTLTSCLITGNDNTGAATGSQGGGGVYCGSSDLLWMSDCTVSGNSSSRWGGGVHIYGWARIEDCVITGNEADGDRGGGGISIYTDSGTVVSDCLITNNQSNGTGGEGGGIYIRSKTDSSDRVDIINCQIEGNTSVDDGAGIYNMSRGVVEITNTAVVGNTGTGSARGIVCLDAASTTADSATILKNCTISGNSSVNGGGICAAAGTTGETALLTVTNCTVFDNAASNSAAPAGIGVVARADGTATAKAWIKNCIVGGNYNSGASAYKDFVVQNTGASINSLDYNLVGENFTFSNGNQSNDDVNQTAAIVNAVGVPFDNGGATDTCRVSDLVKPSDSPNLFYIPSSGNWNGAPLNQGDYNDQRGYYIGSSGQGVYDGENYYDNRTRGAYWQHAASTPSRGFRGRVLF